MFSFIKHILFPQEPLQRKVSGLLNESKAYDNTTPTIYDSEGKNPEEDIISISSENSTNDDHECVPSSSKREMPTERTIKGSLYIHNGLRFECLLEGCDIEFDNEFITFKDDTESNTVHSFSVDRIINYVQNNFGGFEILVHRKKDTYEQYGLDIENASQALLFRKELFRRFIEQTSLFYAIECAVAEYNSESREFVIVSKSSMLMLYQKRKGNLDILIVSNESSDPCDIISSALIIERISKHFEIWCDPSLNRITVYATNYQKNSNDKKLFLVEMDPNLVGEEACKSLFKHLDSLMNPSSREADGKFAGGRKELRLKPDLDGFDNGTDALPKYKRMWRKTEEANNLDSYIDSMVLSHENARTGEENSSSDSEDVEEYLADNKKNPLVHRFMEVGSDRTFVCRGEYKGEGFKKAPVNDLKMIVYKQNSGNENSLSLVGTIKGSQFSYKNEQFTPCQGLLHQQESKMVILPEESKGDVLMMDLEAEKVIQKWTPKGEPVSNIFSTFKRAQCSQDPTFLCTNSKNLILMDSRLPGDKAVANNLTYLSKPQLCSGTTDEKGRILLGSKTGELRLYNGKVNPETKEFRRAKTLLQTVQEPITAVDVTNDGSWLVATTRTFLVVFPTKLAGTDSTGFDVPLGNKKPTPRYLTLSSEDIMKHKITSINFAPAKFDIEEDAIISSTGNMAIVWDFDSVKKRKPFYSIRFTNDLIKDVQIAVDDTNVVVVSLPEPLERRAEFH